MIAITEYESIINRRVEAVDVSTHINTRCEDDNKNKIKCVKRKQSKDIFDQMLQDEIKVLQQYGVKKQ